MATATKTPRSSPRGGSLREGTSRKRNPRKSQTSTLQILKTPGYQRSQFIRRALGLVLVLAAALVALSGLRENPEVVVFARDVDAGRALTADDVATVRVPEEIIPAAGALHTPEEVIGRVLAAPAVGGEIITELRLVGDDLTSFLVPDGHLVPLKLAEPDLVSLLHHGDTVNVVTSQVTAEEPGFAQPLIIAEGARVIATSADISAGGNGGQGSTSGSPATVLIALPAEQAQVVASASISQPLTVVITGDRARLPETPQG